MHRGSFADLLTGVCLFRQRTSPHRSIKTALLIFAVLGSAAAAHAQIFPGTQSQGETQPTSPQGSTNQIGGDSSQRRPPALPVMRAQQVPGAAKTVPAVSALSLRDAISLAIENNLSTLLAKDREREARGFQKQSRAGLLPNISGTAYQASLTENLAALGFTGARIPGFTSTFIGPFKNFDARLRLQQNIFSLSAIRRYQEGRAQVRVAMFEEELAREQVATAAAISYLEAMRADRSVTAAQADVTLAEALLKLAQDQRNAGIATGVDVTRAETRLAQQQVRLSRAQTDSETARLELQRLIGLPLGSSFTLTDPLQFTVENLPGVEIAVTAAENDRAEIHVAAATVTASEYEARATRAEQLPSLEFLGDYGISGITPVTSALPTRRYAVQLNVPIFNGGLTRGRIQVASSREQEAALQLASTRGEVEEDVRLAYAALRTTADTVRAADQAVTLAERELDMARDRFRAGLGDNIELVTAQTTLANARLDQVSALAAYNGARLNLAAALGRAQTFRW